MNLTNTYTILMPCLNEALTLPKCIEMAKLGILQSGLKAEILVADNGSVDGSQIIASDLGARVINVPEKGYGSALYYGCLAAKGNFIIMADSDQSYDFSRLEMFIEKFNQGNEFIIGNRFLGGIAAKQRVLVTGSKCFHVLFMCNHYGNGRMAGCIASCT